MAHHPAAIPAAVRVKITGRTPAHGDLFGLEAQLRLEILAIAAAIGMDRIWIEKVKVATSAADEGEGPGTRGDALADLQDILEAADSDPEFLKSLKDDLLMLVTRAPPELHAVVPYFEEIRSGNLAPLVREVRPGLLSHLEREE
jgi:hypothetical protein